MLYHHPLSFALLYSSSSKGKVADAVNGVVEKFMKLWRNWEVKTFWFPPIKKWERRKSDKQTKKTICFFTPIIMFKVQSFFQQHWLNFFLYVLLYINKILSYHQILRSLHPCLFYIVRSHLDTQTCLLGGWKMTDTMVSFKNSICCEKCGIDTILGVVKIRKTPNGGG